MATQAVKKIYRGVVSYLQYWRGNPVDTYKVIQPEADYYKFNISTSIPAGYTYSVWNTFRNCSKVKITRNLIKKSLGGAPIDVVDENGSKLASLGNTSTGTIIEKTVNAQKLRIRYHNAGVDAITGQSGTITFEPIK